MNNMTKAAAEKRTCYKKTGGGVGVETYKSIK